MRRAKQLLIVMSFLIIGSGITLAAKNITAKPAPPPVTQQAESAAPDTPDPAPATTAPKTTTQPQETSRQNQPNGKESDELLNSDVDKELNGAF